MVGTGLPEGPRSSPHRSSTPARTTPIVLALLVFLLLPSCRFQERSEAEEGSGAPASAERSEAQDEFWAELQSLCGLAFEGALMMAPPGDTQIDPRARLVIDFRDCTEDMIRAPLHVGDDRSRTLVFLRRDDGLELRHDHRRPDGSEGEVTWYGTTTIDGGWPFLQDFVTVRDGVRVGWRVELHPDYRFNYGTIRDELWGHLLEFDITREVEPPPPAWGFDSLPSSLR